MTKKLSLNGKRPLVYSGLITLFLLIILFLAGMISVVAEINSDITFFIAFLAVAVSLVLFISKNNRWAYYGFSLSKRNNIHKNYIFIPLFILAFMPIFAGVSSDLTFRKIIYLILYMALVAFVEETIFRGIIIKLLLKKGLTTAIIGSSILFSLSHLLNSLQASNLASIMSQIFYALIIGIILAIVVIKTNNIIIGILYHYLNNLMSSLNPGVNNLLSTTISTIMFGMAIIYLIYLFSSYLYKRPFV